MKETTTKVIAGALIQYEDAIVLVRRARDFHGVDAGKGLWEPPGGTVEPGEKIEDALKREVREETGIDGRLVEKIDDIKYWYSRDGARVLKVVSFFLLAYRSGSVRDYQEEEVEGAEWVPLEEAPDRLSYRGEKEMARAALSKLAEEG